MTQPYDHPAAGPVPVPVHVTGVADGVSLGQAAPAGRDRIRTRFLTETVDDTNRVRPLLPDDPDRVGAYVLASGGDVVLCASQSDALQTPPAGSVLPFANGESPWPIRGQNAVWAAQRTAATSCIISVTADYVSSS